MTPQPDDDSPQQNCRLCSEPLHSCAKSYAIERAPLSINELPPVGSRRQGFAPLELLQCQWCGHFQLGDPAVPTWKYAVTAGGISEEMRRFRLMQFQDFCDRYDLEGIEILEIGCGDGKFLDLLAQAGLSARGLEAAPHLVSAGNARGRAIKEGHPQDGGLDGESLHAFACINFLEHATQPVQFLRNIRAACESGAVGLIEVPDFDQDLRIGRSHDLVREHLSYFTERTLRLALETSGFDVLSMRRVWHDDDLEAIVIARAPAQLADWDARNPTLELVRSFCDDPDNQPVAVWGASHQALTILGMIGRNGVIAIADSAPHKQGKQDPVWSIPIVSPRQMLDLQPRSVLVMAAGYSQEVATMLRRMGFDGRAAALVGAELVQV